MTSERSELGATRSVWLLLSALSASEDPRERARLVATGLPRLVPCHLSGMALWTEELETWHGTVQLGGQPLEPEPTESLLTELGPYLRHALREPRLTVLTASCPREHGATPILDRWQLDHLLVAPVRTLDRLIGAFFVAARGGTGLADTDEELLLVLAHQLAVGFENLCLLREQRSAARRLERQNQLLLESAGEGIYGLDCEGRTTFVNPAAASMLGWSAEELIGQSMHAVLHHTRPDGSPYPAEECPIYSAFKEGKVREVDHEVFWNRDGASLPVEYTSTPVREGGQVVGAVVVFRDVGPLRRALREVEELKERLEAENDYLRDEIRSERGFEAIVGDSAALKRVLDAVREVAPADANVVITGETGTGKELVARAIHSLSLRRDRPLVRVNCPSIPKELFESEFFGHAKGAFTGAAAERVGRFELADGGTVFLDEVGEIPVELQSKLLRVLQEGEYERVGEARSRRVDVRVIAASNRDLEGEMHAGRFREDLYYRLAVFPIHVPDLRQRRDDIPILARHFLTRAARRLNRPVPELSEAAEAQLLAHHWPGNVRELMNVVERAVIRLGRGGLRFEISARPEARHPALAPAHGPGTMILTAAEMRRRERDNLENALRLSGGKIYGPGGAAELLGVKPTTLASRIKALRVRA